MKFLLFLLVSFPAYSLDLSREIGVGSNNGRIHIFNDELVRSRVNLPHNRANGIHVYDSYADEVRAHNRIINRYIEENNPILVLNPMPDLSLRCELRSQGYVKSQEKCVNLRSLSNAVRCPDGSYVRGGDNCPEPSYSGNYIDNQNCSRDKILNSAAECTLPNGFELKENGAIGRVGDGYPPAIRQRVGHSFSANNANQCEVVTDAYVLCHGHRYERARSTFNSLSRITEQVEEGNSSNQESSSSHSTDQ